MVWIIYKNTRFDSNEISTETVDCMDDEFLKNSFRIISDWNSGREFFSLKTSGSTAEPKEYFFNKKQLIASARQTGNFFNLLPNESLFCCLPLDHAAGFMMLIRGLVLNLDICLQQPTGNPLETANLLEKPSFAAFTGMQLINILEKSPEKLFFLNRMKAIIVGGGKSTHRLSELIDLIKIPVYETFGMTETLTHIALRRINGNRPAHYFTLLPGIKIRTDENDCLVVCSEVTENRELFTNDVIRLMPGNSFEWIGRLGYFVNSGGIKLAVAVMEDKISAFFTEKKLKLSFFLFKNDDEKLGERLEMAVEKNPEVQMNENEMKKLLSGILLSVEMPRQIHFIDHFQYTSLGKTDKPKTIAVLYQKES